jgi:ABC-type antimicrobial peptide transport system permease subunit
VGVTADIRQQLDGDAPDLWLPYAQVASTSMVLALHLRPGTPSPVPALEEILRRLDPEVAITSVATLDETTAAARGPSRFLAAILAGFSLFALTLAVLGLYGVVSYAAARRSRDVALRMALGARAGQVVGLFVRESLPVIAAGLAVGTAGAALLARLLASQLRGISPWHVPTYGAVALVLAAAALLAAWLPARRAAAGDPATVLHDA